MRLYVGNLPTQVQENDLEKTFADFGQVHSVNIVRTQPLGQSVGYGFVIMPQHEQARSAMAALNGQKRYGRNLRVEKGKKRLVQRGGSGRHKG